MWSYHRQPRLVRSSSFTLLLASRMILGLSSGVLLVAAFSAVAKMVPPEKIGSAIGTVILGFSSAMILGVPIGIVLTECSAGGYLPLPSCRQPHYPDRHGAYAAGDRRRQSRSVQPTIHRICESGHSVCFTAGPVQRSWQLRHVYVFNFFSRHILHRSASESGSLCSHSELPAQSAPALADRRSINGEACG